MFKTTMEAQPTTNQDVWDSYQKLLDRFSSGEMARIVQLKRFFEWTAGDPAFRKQATTGDFSPDTRERLRRIGVTFDPEDLAILWKFPDEANRFILNCHARQEKALPDEVAQKIADFPLFALWGRYLATRNSFYRETRAMAPLMRIPANPEFDAWRSRRIRSTQSELGHFGHSIDHPILAFELGDGCNVGCWFCAFATRKLTRNFEYDEHHDFFRQITQVCVDLFGRLETSMALLYYGTEPHDNPHYLDFVKDYNDITGFPVCTSTAVPTDPVWMRELIAFYRRFNSPWPRLSVLTRAMLLKIHDLYTPEELRDVELLMQLKQGQREKVTGGRILKDQAGMREREQGHYLDNVVPQGSIACVSGFLINMVRRSVQIVSPCYTSQQWPYGYRVFDEATFTDAADFRRVMETLIDRNMPVTLPKDMPIRFRDDLVYHRTEQGFDLVSPNQIHHFTDPALHVPLGKLVAEGTYRYDSLYDRMTTHHGRNPMMVILALNTLFDQGLLNEVFFQSSASSECQ